VTRPRIVIVGAGFGGLFAAQALARVDADVTIVDRHNYHLFQPLLYQVATAGLPPSDVAWPIRSILHRQHNATVLLGEVTAIDTRNNSVLLGERTLPYDYLIVATGATHSYFGHDDWQPFAPGLKSIDDATAIRRRVLSAFEAAEMETDATRRDALLRFVIVGAGPTGVELAGTIAELARFTLAADFRRIDPRSAKIVLVEAGARVLAAFKEPQSAYALRALAKLGVDVRVGAAVTACDAGGVWLGTERLPSATVIWAAGVAASPVAGWLGAPTDRAGPRARATGPLGGHECLRHRRLGERDTARRPARARRCAGGQAAGTLCGQSDRGAHRRPPASAAVRVPRPRQSRNDRSQVRRHRVPVRVATRLPRVVDLGRRTYLFLGRRAEPGARIVSLAVGIPDVRPRRAPHHRS
jgi:hypothetical protein